jgi:hypothetical protein
MFSYCKALYSAGTGVLQHENCVVTSQLCCYVTLKILLPQIKRDEGRNLRTVILRY